MLDFTYYTPTKVHFGKEKHKEVGKIIKEYGFKTVMMQYGQSSIKKSGLYDEVMESLCENGIKVIEAMEDFFKAIKMPLTLREFDIPESSERLADLCTFGKQRTVKSYIELNYEKIKKIFESCY